MKTPPSIDSSTREERQAYVREKWECMHNCELCGKCHILKGRDAPKSSDREIRLDGNLEPISDVVTVDPRRT